MRFLFRVILRSNECIKSGILSRKVLGNQRALKQILDYIKKNFADLEDVPYVVVATQPRNEYDALTIFSLLFPRVSPAGNDFVAPIFFVPDGESLPT